MFNLINNLHQCKLCMNWIELDVSVQILPHSNLSTVPLTLTFQSKSFKYEFDIAAVLKTKLRLTSSWRGQMQSRTACLTSDDREKLSSSLEICAKRCTIDWIYFQTENHVLGLEC